jgi:hypothetical protein
MGAGTVAVELARPGRAKFGTPHKSGLHRYGKAAAGMLLHAGSEAMRGENSPIHPGSGPA